jgi:hypothetical protein
MDVFVSSILRPLVYQLGGETLSFPSISPVPSLSVTYICIRYVHVRPKWKSVNSPGPKCAHDARSAAIVRASRGCQCGVSPIMCTIIQCYMARRPPSRHNFVRPHLALVFPPFPTFHPSFLRSDRVFPLLVISSIISEAAICSARARRVSIIQGLFSSRPCHNFDFDAAVACQRR